jgi:hypothetical protein
VIRYKPEIVTTLAALPDYVMSGDVTYDEAVPALRWFSEPPEDIMRPVLLTKSLDWTYEVEHRTVLTGPPCQEVNCPGFCGDAFYLI